MKKIINTLLLLGTFLQADVVRLTEKIPFLYTTHLGEKIKVARIQDTDNVLTDDYAKTSRPCPPFCIHPIKVNDDIETIGEVEMMDFFQHEVADKTGLIIDARLESWYDIETIPSAINIPFPTTEKGTKESVEPLFKLLGMTIDTNGTWNFDHVKKLAVFCNGVWCDQSHRLIDGMLKFGYPAKKMLYYRDGFQGWKLLGITTIVSQEINK